jgi:hypothetical protein
MGMRQFFMILSAMLSLTPVPASAAPATCEALAARATLLHGLPQGILSAIARTESGRAVGEMGVRAWPWTANIQGQGMYFDTRAQLLGHLEAVLSQGETRFDVGCMQLNYRWHSAQFPNLNAMLDPARNVDYAARYLRHLYAETGDWDAAIRFYHSRDADLGQAYLGRVKRALKTIETGTPPKVADRAEGQTAPSITRPDQRFQSKAPLIPVRPPSQYWEKPNLPLGRPPSFPEV